VKSGRSRAGHSRKAPPSAAQAHSAFHDLQRGLTGGRGLIGESYMDDPGKLDAYLAYYWPISREQARHALAVSASEGMSFRRVIDVGSGPGPVAAAFIDGGADAVALIDQSRRALDLACRELPARCAFPASIETVVADVSAPSPALIPLWERPIASVLAIPLTNCTQAFPIGSKGGPLSLRGMPKPSRPAALYSSLSPRCFRRAATFSRCETSSLGVAGVSSPHARAEAAFPVLRLSPERRTPATRKFPGRCRPRPHRSRVP